MPSMWAIESGGAGFLFPTHWVADVEQWFGSRIEGELEYLTNRRQTIEDSILPASWSAFNLFEGKQWSSAMLSPLGARSSTRWPASGQQPYFSFRYAGSNLRVITGQLGGRIIHMRYFSVGVRVCEDKTAILGRNF